MSDMDGNSHYANARRWDNKPMGPTDIALMAAQATLALAYEHRTANLIALMAIGVTDMTGWPAEFVEVNVKRNEIIKARLGLNERTAP